MNRSEPLLSGRFVKEGLVDGAVSVAEGLP